MTLLVIYPWNFLKGTYESSGGRIFKNSYIRNLTRKTDENLPFTKSIRLSYLHLSIFYKIVHSIISW